ncbi:MAG: OB-fold protein [Peptoniphilaceae bacterium]
MKKKIKDEDGKVYVEKKPFYKKWWFILIIVIIVAAFFIPSDDSTNQVSDAEQPTKTEMITYTPADAGQLLKDLEANALNAEKTYKDKDLEVTGKVYVIDSDGQYIAIDGVNDEFTMTGITCYVKNDDQLDVIAGLTKGQSVVVKGKITEIGEVLGYHMDIDSIEAK